MQATTRASKLVALGSGTLLLAASLLPGAASAAELHSPAIAATPKQSLFCSSLQTKSEAVNNRLSTLQTELSAAQTKHTATLQDNWGTYGTKLSGLQAQWQTDRNAQYTKLASLATTDAEKAAVTAFETTVNNAITARESANALARTTYQNGVLAAAKTESASISAAGSTLQSAVNGQVATLEADCQSASSASTQTGTSLSPEVTAARQAYEQAVQTARTTFQSTVKSLKATETTTIQQNDATFQTALTAATTTLKAAFGQS